MPDAIHRARCARLRITHRLQPDSFACEPHASHPPSMRPVRENRHGGPARDTGVRLALPSRGDVCSGHAVAHITEVLTLRLPGAAFRLSKAPNRPTKGALSSLRLPSSRRPTCCGACRLGATNTHHLPRCGDTNAGAARSMIPWCTRIVPKYRTTTRHAPAARTCGSNSEMRTF
jgi:hypothetical protein